MAAEPGEQPPEEQGRRGQGPEPDPAGPREARVWDLEHVPMVNAFRPHGAPPADGVVYADLPLRAVAYTIDVLLLSAAGVATMAFAQWLSTTYIVLSMASSLPPWLSLTNAVAPVASLLIGAVAYVYFLRVYRATPGQQVLGLFTLGKSGAALTGRQALVRWALRMLPAGVPSLVTSLLFYVVLDDPFHDPVVGLGTLGTLLSLVPVVWPLLLAWSIALDREQGRGWHDRLAGSVVVRRDGPPN